MLSAQSLGATRVICARYHSAYCEPPRRNRTGVFCWNGTSAVSLSTVAFMVSTSSTRSLSDVSTAICADLILVFS